MSSNISRGDDSSSDERELSQTMDDKRDHVREILVSPPDDNETEDNDEELGFNERELTNASEAQFAGV